jgi:hypothetical protein
MSGICRRNLASSCHSEYRQLPDEGFVLGAMRNGKIAPGFYAFPYAGNMKEMGTPEMMEKYAQGPVGTVNINPSGAPAMGKSLAYFSDAIWRMKPWSMTLKRVFDGLVYGLLTDGVFGWLWP